MTYSGKTASEHDQIVFIYQTVLFPFCYMTTTDCTHLKIHQFIFHTHRMLLFLRAIVNGGLYPFEFNFVFDGQCIFNNAMETRYFATQYNLVSNISQLQQWYDAKFSLQWRHNGRHGVSNHQLHDCLLNRLPRRRSKEASKVRVTGLCAGNSTVGGDFTAQMSSNAENASIWWRHHVELGTFAFGHEITHTCVYCVYHMYLWGEDNSGYQQFGKYKNRRVYPSPKPPPPFFLIKMDLPTSSSIRRTKFLNLNVSRLVLQLSLPNRVKPGVESSMKTWGLEYTYGRDVVGYWQLRLTSRCRHPDPGQDLIPLQRLHVFAHSRDPHPAIKLWCQVPFTKSKTTFQIEMYCM